MKRPKKIQLIILPLVILLLSGSLFSRNLIMNEKSQEIPVLTYHCLTDDPAIAKSDPLYVSSKKFAEDLDYLKKNGYTTIFAKDMDQPLPPKPVVITFDDGYKNNDTYGYPLLKQYGMKATIFIIASAMGSDRKLTWPEARALADSGVIDIQSHTYNLHHRLEDGTASMEQSSKETETAYRSRVNEDINQTNERFDQYMGYRPKAFAYPYGAYNVLNDQILKAADYTVTFTSENKIGKKNDSLYLFPRVEIYEHTSLGYLLMKYTLINLFS